MFSGNYAAAGECSLVHEIRATAQVRGSCDTRMAINTEQMGAFMRHYEIV